MRKIKIEKVTLNIGVGESGEKLERAKRLLENLTGRKPIITLAKKRIPTWGVRPGLPIGVKVTLRGKKAIELLPKLFQAIENKVKKENFDGHGNLNFGIREYIQIPGMKFDPAVGMFGMNVSITLERPGYRVKKRGKRKSKVGKRHIIRREEGIEFFEKNFGIRVA